MDHNHYGEAYRILMNAKNMIEERLGFSAFDPQGK